MTTDITINRNTTALLAMDFQTLIVDGYATDQDRLLGTTAKLLDAARNAGVMVIYVVVGFRAGYPEVSERNLSFGAIRQSGRFAPGATSAEIHPAVARRPDEVVVTKHRVNAFAGTDLDMILRANNIDTLLLSGIATSGVVLSTLRHAADADYRLMVVRDCCSDADAEVHRVLINKVFPRQAAVVSADATISALAALD